MSYSVSFITNYIKSLLESDIRLHSIEVEGEISNVTYHKNGNVYFSLKDEGAVLSAVIFSNYVSGLKMKLKMGDHVIAKGRITLFPQRGAYQLNVSQITPAGVGRLYQKYLELKDELEQKGMFDEIYKRPIPKYIKTLGVVTSPTGAAIRDIINITKRRNPFVSIILYPVLVQGEGAAFSVADGIMELDNYGVDLIIAGRGGGSIEDLWAFNEEIVAEAIFSSNTPIISAVGHETDFTIADFVADLRAPTPSAAAELGVFDVYELLSDIRNLRNRLDYDMDRTIGDLRQLVENKNRHLMALSPENILAEKKRHLARLNDALDSAMDRNLERTRERMRRVAAGLSALSPTNRLAQGYSYVTGSKGKNIYKTTDVKNGEILNIRVTDGNIKAEVCEIEKERKSK